MAALLCNRVVSFTRLISRNANGKMLFSEKTLPQRVLTSISLRYYSNGDLGKEKNEDKEPQERKKINDDLEKEGPTEDDPYAPFPDDVNPVTGEKGGPRGPEPTRYGDWERKGRCIDF